VLQSDDEDANEKAPPEPDEVSEVLVKTEQYLANKVLVESDHEYLRLSCRKSVPFGPPRLLRRRPRLYGQVLRCCVSGL
jgi:hypothetical protein